MTRTRQRVLVVVLALAAFLVPAATAYAVWSATATVSMTVSTIPPTPPPPPTGLSCSGSNNAITLSWGASTGAASYEVYRKDGPAGFNLAGSTTSLSLLLNEGLMGNPQVPNGKYDVIVRAITAEGASADSAIFKIQFKPNCVG